YVNVRVVEFENFEEVKKKLPPIIKSLKFEGEWNLSLYQIPGDFKIKHMYGYYKVPKRDKLVLELSYMNVCRNLNIFITDAIIHIYSTTGIQVDSYGNNTEIAEGHIFEEFITVLLYSDTKNRKSITDEFYTIENYEV